MDRRHRYYVTVQPPGDLVLSYDERGRFIRKLGRRGNGPGEFTFPIVVLPRPNGELLVYDFDGAKLTTLDENWSFRGRHFQPTAPLGELHDGRLISSWPSFDRESFGYALQLYTDSGKLIRTFGRSDSVVDRQEAWRLRRMVAVSPRNTIWAGHTDRYQVDEIAESGVVLRSFVSSPPWLTRFDRPAGGTNGERPTPEIVAVSENGGQVLWVFSRVPSADWRAALGKPLEAPGQPPYYRDRDEGRLFDTIVDVIDLSTGKLFVSRRLRMHVRFALGEHRVAVYREERGVPLVDVYVMRLEGSPPGRR